MKILYIHQYFHFPNEYGGTRSYWIAKKFVSAGHDVTVITSTNRKQDKLIKKEKIENLNIIYIRIPYDNKMSKGKRVFAFVKFMLLSIIYLQKQNNIDLVYATSTPLTIGVPALFRYYISKTPFIFEVRDLWPEFPIQVGAIKNRTLIKMLQWFEKLIYEKSIHIVALSPGMKAGVLKTGIDDNKVTVIPNMSKPDLFYPRKKSSKLASGFNIDLSKFNVIHFGAMGVANGLDYIIDAAIIAQKKKAEDLNFIFLGDGFVKNNLIVRVQKEGLNNVQFIDKQNLETTSEVVNLCDVSVVSFMKIPVTKTNSPNKLFDSLSAGKPIIVNSSGWTKKLVEDNNCGFFVNPDYPDELIQKIIQLKNDKLLYNALCNNARELSIKEFDKEKLTDEIVRLVEQINL